MKPQFEAKARTVFEGTGVKIRCSQNPKENGARHLGGALGTQEFAEEYVRTKVEKLCDELSVLADFAKHEPQAAHAVFTHAFLSKLNYLQRVIPVQGSAYQPLETLIRNSLLPQTTGQGHLSDLEREIFTLPARDGGLGIPDPTQTAQKNFQNSREITSALTRKIIAQQTEISTSEIENWQEQKREIIRTKRREQQERKKEILDKIRPPTPVPSAPGEGRRKEKPPKPPDPPALRMIEMASQKGASAWLTTIPLKEYGWAVSKAEWHDAMSMRYGWRPAHLPSTCACGKRNDLQHPLDCPLGGFQIFRHNTLRDTFSEFFKKAGYKDVRTEHQLAPMPPEMQRRTRGGVVRSTDGDEARLDISAVGVWGAMQRAFFDVRVTNPLAPSYAQRNLDQHLKNEEQSKKNDYNRRVLEVERGTFTPLVFSISGGCGKEADTLLKRLTEKLSAATKSSPSGVMNFLRTTISFALLRLNHVCLRGERKKKKEATTSPELADVDFEIASAESGTRREVSE